MTDHSLDLVVFAIVVASRILVPLAIPRFPLPAIIAAMVIDAADQTIFQQFTSLDLTNYQSYDKALDVYYLAIAFLATMRNWTNQTAFNTGRFLWYYRLLGTTLFELTHIRTLLLIFPNTFEYFFDFYEAVRLRWDPRRLTKRMVIGAAAFIWIFIKLPQEYWIHVAQLDTTDLIKEDLFKVPVDTGWGEIISNNLIFFLGLGLLLAALIGQFRYMLRNVFPPADWALAFDADAHGRDVSEEQIQEQVKSMRGRIMTIELLEKVFLIGLISIIFTRIVPGHALDPWQQILIAAMVLVLDTVISGFWARRRFSYQSMVSEFIMLGLSNIALLVALRSIGDRDDQPSLGGSIMMMLLLTILITMYDRYRPIYLARFGDSRFEVRMMEQLQQGR